jgi:hypothetical protein
MTWREFWFGTVGILIGVVVDQFATYFRERLTTNQTAAKIERQRRDAFALVQTEMPVLIREMVEDVRRDPLIREFVVLTHEGIRFNGSQERFIYYISSHPDLMAQLNILENHGYVLDVTPSDTSIYRFTEE